MEPKDIIAPLQQWLLTKGRCVGCGRPLKEAKEQKKNGIVLIACECRRIFVHDPKVDSYRRALFEEVKIDE
jgi:hypothetical protein